MVSSEESSLGPIFHTLSILHSLLNDQLLFSTAGSFGETKDINGDFVLPNGLNLQQKYSIYIYPRKMCAISSQCSPLLWYRIHSEERLSVTH